MERVDTMNEEISRIKVLSDAFGPSGMEDDVIRKAMQSVPEQYDTKLDTMHNLYIVPKEKKDGCTILLDAHCDEVGFIVQAVLANGTVRFLPLGGWNPVNVAGSAVKIKTENGFVSGIVAAKPVHFMGEAEKKAPVSFESLVIDAGTSSKEETMALGIVPGCFIVPDVTCEYIEKQRIFKGKAFDCRIGCAALLQTLHTLPETSNTVTGVLTVQEEVGERGSSLAVQNIKADVAICFEGCPADDSFERPDMVQTAMKKGVMLRAFDCSMITHPAFQKFALDCAEKADIPYQVAVRKGGGTNGGIYHLHDIPTIVIGIPTRFAHSTAGFCSYDDYLGAVRLAREIIKNINQNVIDSFRHVVM